MNAAIDKQDGVARMGLVSSEEVQECNDWFDEIAMMNDIDDDHAEHVFEQWRTEQYADAQA